VHPPVDDPFQRCRENYCEPEANSKGHHSTEQVAWPRIQKRCDHAKGKCPAKEEEHNPFVVYNWKMGDVFIAFRAIHV